MSATLNSTLADPQQTIADLRRKLAECEAERDAALAREAATAEVLQVVNFLARQSHASVRRNPGEGAYALRRRAR